MSAIYLIEPKRFAGLRPRPTAFGLRPANRFLRKLKQLIEQYLYSSREAVKLKIIQALHTCLSSGRFKGFIPHPGEQLKRSDPSELNDLHCTTTFST